MTGDGDDGDNGRPDEVRVAETLDDMLAGDDSGLCAGLLDVLALLSDVGTARWVLHRAGDLALAAAPGGYGVHEAFAPEVIDAALAELAEAGLLTIDEAVSGDAGDGYDDGVDVAGGGSGGSEDRQKACDAGQEDAGCPDDLAGSGQVDREEDYLDESAFDTVTVAPHAARIIVARHVAAGTIAEPGARACGLLNEAARSGAGIDSVLLADGMAACWDRLRPFLGPADGELVKDLLTMRSWGLYSLVLCPDATEAGTIEFGEKLVAVMGPRDSLTLSVRGQLGEAYLQVGRTAEGTELMEAAAAGLAAVAGPGFPEVTRLREAIDEARSL
ncbi:MAG TPA: hypothetical protein VF070_42100 [Streptosporangiaceae bacterium]